MFLSFANIKKHTNAMLPNVLVKKGIDRKNNYLARLGAIVLSIGSKKQK